MDIKDLTLTHSAITTFIGEPVVELNRFDNSIVFVTASGNTGFVEPNDFTGDWNVWVGEELVYEIEGPLFEVLEYEDKGRRLVEMYNYMKTIDPETMKFRSKSFFEIVKSTVEKTLLEGYVPIDGETVIGSTELHFIDPNKAKTPVLKMKIDLN